MRWAADPSRRWPSPAFRKRVSTPKTIAAIFRGGFDKLREAGVALLGGHTVQDREIKFGYAVTGAVDPKRILTNAGAQPGDRLILTKPLGTGIVGTAIKFGRAPTELDRSRRRPDARAEQAWRRKRSSGVDGVHACTDITGFGLAGHVSEMAAGSHVTIEIDVEGAADHRRGARHRRARTFGRDGDKQGALRCQGSNSWRADST